MTRTAPRAFGYYTWKQFPYEDHALAMKENPKRKKKFINWVTLGHVLSSFPKQLRITEVITWPVWPREHDPVENHSESWRVQGRKGWLEPIPKGRRPALRSHGFVAKT